MRYLKTYNESISSKFKKIFKMDMSFWEWFVEEYKKGEPHRKDYIKNPSLIKKIECNYYSITAPIKIKNLDGIEKLINLEELSCRNNKLTSLKGIENLKKLKILFCQENNLKNLDEIKNLPNLEELHSRDNLFDEPIPYEIVDKFGIPQIYGFRSGMTRGRKYMNPLYEKFSAYDFQKEFLTKYPDRVKDLEPFGYDERIKQEFPKLITGVEWGFFDLNEK